MGQRVGREANGERDTYLLDLTKAYHNLLSINGKDKKQTFYWDNNVTAMEEEGDGLQELHYYLQDELGSPLRVSITDGYLTYGYDEFGNDLGRELEKAGIPNPYTNQGEAQPFGYTGYRYDNISSTYFAQAREYQPKSGRFTAEDVIKGNGVAPITLNPYSYCLNNTLRYVDLNGKNPLIVILVAVGASVALGGCGKPLDEEDIIPMPEANSPYEFENSMEIYNSKEYIYRTNCYAYAFDIIENPITEDDLGHKINHTFENPWAMQPGMFCNEYNEVSYARSLGTSDYSKELFISHIKGDAKALGIEFQEYEEGMTGGYIVAIATMQDEYGGDYHFYRENGDGTWSSKRGAKKVETGIENPQVHAYDNEYKTFLGYFYVTKMEEETYG